MELETNRLKLRKIHQDDIDIIYNTWMKDENVSKYMFWKASENIEDTKRFVSFELDNINNPKWNRYIIQIKETNIVIGTCLLFYYEEENHYDISYNLGSKYWGQGYGYEAMKKLIDYAKENGIETIETSYAKENIASGKLLDKLGFKIIKEIPFVCNGGDITTQGYYVRIDL